MITKFKIRQKVTKFLPTKNNTDYIHTHTRTHAHTHTHTPTKNNTSSAGYPCQLSIPQLPGRIWTNENKTSPSYHGFILLNSSQWWPMIAMEKIRLSSCISLLQLNSCKPNSYNSNNHVIRTPIIRIIM